MFAFEPHYLILKEVRKLDPLGQFPVLDMNDQTKIRSWYIGYLAYNYCWKDLIALLNHTEFDPIEVSTVISECIQRDFIALYKGNYISELVNYLPHPGTKDAENLALLLWLDDEQYAKDYAKLSQYYKNKEARISRYLYRTSGLSGVTP